MLIRAIGFLRLGGALTIAMSVAGTAAYAQTSAAASWRALDTAGLRARSDVRAVYLGRFADVVTPGNETSWWVTMPWFVNAYIEMYSRECKASIVDPVEIIVSTTTTSRVAGIASTNTENTRTGIFATRRMAALFKAQQGLVSWEARQGRWREQAPDIVTMLRRHGCTGPVQERFEANLLNLYGGRAPAFGGGDEVFRDVCAAKLPTAIDRPRAGACACLFPAFKSSVPHTRLEELEDAFDREAFLLLATYREGLAAEVGRCVR